MANSNDNERQIVVVKIGGSILRDDEAYGTAAEFVGNRIRATPHERYVAVVSAQNGMTDAQERAARQIAPTCDPRLLDLLWSTGELRSVALLTMHLHALSLLATGLNVHQTGLKYRDATDFTREVTFATNGLQSALAQNAVVVVPGFLATTSAGSIVSLGRGGSDLTAVLLAVGLSAVRCELVKDVPGYFTTDPHVDGSAEHIPVLSFEKALQLADAGCDLVQRRAIEVAREASLPLVVRNLTEGAPKSIVSG